MYLHVESLRFNLWYVVIYLNTHIKFLRMPDSENLTRILLPSTKLKSSIHSREVTDVATFAENFQRSC